MPDHVDDRRIVLVHRWQPADHGLEPASDLRPTTSPPPISNRFAAISWIIGASPAKNRPREATCWAASRRRFHGRADAGEGRKPQPQPGGENDFGFRFPRQAKSKNSYTNKFIPATKMPCRKRWIKPINSQAPSTGPDSTVTRVQQTLDVLFASVQSLFENNRARPRRPMSRSSCRCEPWRPRKAPPSDRGFSSNSKTRKTAWPDSWKPSTKSSRELHQRECDACSRQDRLREIIAQAEVLVGLRSRRRKKIVAPPPFLGRGKASLGRMLERLRAVAAGTRRFARPAISLAWTVHQLDFAARPTARSAAGIAGHFPGIPVLRFASGIRHGKRKLGVPKPIEKHLGYDAPQASPGVGRPIGPVPAADGVYRSA